MPGQGMLRSDERWIKMLEVMIPYSPVLQLCNPSPAPSISVKVVKGSEMVPVEPKFGVVRSHLTCAQMESNHIPKSGDRRHMRLDLFCQV